MINNSSHFANKSNVYKLTHGAEDVLRISLVNSSIYIDVYVHVRIKNAKTLINMVTNHIMLGAVCAK